MRPVFRHIFICLLLLTVAALMHHVNKKMYFQVVQPQAYRWLTSDSTAFALPAYADTHWRSGALPPDPALWWLRAEVEIPPYMAGKGQLALDIDVMASAEIYFDGVLIGKNGRVGESLPEEEPGRKPALFALPDSLASPGPHVLAVRLSNFHAGDKVRFYGIFLSNLQETVQFTARFTAFVHVAAGIFLVIAIYYLLIFLIAHRQGYFLIFSLLCFCFFLLLLVEYVKYYYFYPYPHHFTRLAFITGLTFLISVLSPLFFARVFGLPVKAYWAWLLAIALGFIIYSSRSYDLKNFLMIRTAFLLCLLLAAWAMARKAKGSTEGFYGICGCLLILLDTDDASLFFGFSVLVVFVLIALARQQKELQQREQQAQLQAARLEAELLKKNIQPHFILNTLTSLMEWIERSPRQANRMIEELAGEFRLLSEISGQALIPLRQELDLCRSHLRIMGFRKDLAFELQTQGLDETDTIPPAVFHTLIENGLSHNVFHKKENLFRITCQYRPGARIYTVFCEGEVQEPAAAAGMGLRYVKARLEESYPGRWQLRAENTGSGWQTTLVLPLTVK